MPVKGVFKLTSRMLTHGKLHQTGPDYSAMRMKTLSELATFCPPGLLEEAYARQTIVKNPYLKSCLAQAAFFKNALKAQAGHLCFPAVRLAYIRIPKAGSTALSYAILKGRFPDLEGKHLTAEKINFLADVNLASEIIGPEKATTFFTVVRNPFRRIVSFYYNFFERAGKEFVYEDYLFGIFRNDMSFKTFVKLVEVIPDRLKDQHVRPQHVFLKYYEKRNVRLITFRLEEASPLREFLSDFGLSADVINKSDGIHDYRHYYDQETLEVVYRIYRKDVSKFGYADEYAALQRFVSGG